MNFKVLLPRKIFLEADATKVTAESPAGRFTLLPRHIDYVTALEPGILSYTKKSEQHEFHMAVDSGILVKQGNTVLAAVIRAVSGELGELGEKVREIRERRREQEQKAHTAATKLEADFIRRFLEFGSND